MKHLNRGVSGILTLVLAAAGLVAGRMPARADIITLDVSATLSVVSGGAACPGTCALGGSFVINNTTGTVGSGDINITASGFSPSIGSFTTFGAIFADAGAGLTTVQFSDAADDTLFLDFSTPTPGSLVGYAGGSLVNPTHADANVSGLEIPTWSISGTGTLAPVAVPAPLIGRGLPALLAVIVILFGARLLERGKRYRDNRLTTSN